MKTNCLKNQAYWKTTVTNGNIYWIIITTASPDHFLQLCDNLCSPLGKWGHRFFWKRKYEVTILVPLRKLLTNLREDLKGLTLHPKRLKTMSQTLQYLLCI